MVQGDLRYFEPGRQVSVRVVADTDGNVPERGDPVQLVGEDEGHTEVQALADDGEGIGALQRGGGDDYDDDETADLEEGDVLGSGTVLVTGPVDWYNETDGEDLSVDDLVVLTSDGVRAYDDDPGDDTPLDLFGRVFATGTRASAETAEKVAVLRYK